MSYTLVISQREKDSKTSKVDCFMILFSLFFSSICTLNYVKIHPETDLITLLDNSFLSFSFSRKTTSNLRFPVRNL